MTTFKANRKLPNPITVTDDPKSHTIALQQVIEALNIGQRRTREIGSSYVRVSELVDMGLIEVVGNQLKLTNTGAAVAGGGTTLDSLSDVTVAGPTAEQGIFFNGTNWENTRAPFMRGAAFVSASGLAASAEPVSLYFKNSATINRVVIIGDASGTCQISLKKIARASYTGPTSGSNIVGADPPVVTAALQSVKTSFTGWTLTIAADDILNIGITSVSGFARLTVQIYFEE